MTKYQTSSEKMIEILFMCYVFQSFSLGELTAFAPSAREEADLGYDTSFSGANFREIYLQFKKPQSHARNGFTFEINPFQHETLLGYPKGSAFYVSHIFLDGLEIQREQQNAKVATYFLNYYLAIDVTAIPLGSTKIDYIRRGNPVTPKQPFHNFSQGERFNQEDKTIAQSDYCTGSQLIEGFKTNELGRLINPNEDYDAFKGQAKILNPKKSRFAEEIENSNADQDDGLKVALRKEIQS